MSKVLVVSYRRSPPIEAVRGLAKSLNTRLMPDNIVPREASVQQSGSSFSILLNPTGTERVAGASIQLGLLLESDGDWPRAGARKPDGSYALFRVSDGAIEAVADPAASRTIWYVLTDQLFASSTSQRAIIALLGDVQPDNQAAAWMLSSGTLGPGNSWDQRLSCLQAGGSVRFDRKTWSLAVDSPPVEFAEDRRADPAAHRDRLRFAVESVISRMSFETARWVLPLSGGFDSRALLLFLGENHRLPCVTWGLLESQEDPRNDAFIARKVAKALGAEHRFFPIDMTEEPLDRLLTRFVVAGEGRVARISGYLDGFRVWKTLFDENVSGIVRGDHAFGRIPVRSEDEVRSSSRLVMLTDIFNATLHRDLELPTQEIPPYLARRAGESLSTWRDRTYQQFSLPVLMAALTDLKLPYVDVANPFLCREVIDVVRSLPDELRTSKKAWREVVIERTPPIEFASRAGPASLADFLRRDVVAGMMLDELSSGPAAALLGSRFSRYLRDGVEAARVSGSPKRSRLARCRASTIARVGDMLPRPVREAVRQLKGPKREKTPDISVLAFRAVLGLRAISMLEHDVRAIVRPDGGGVESLETGFSGPE